MHNKDANNRSGPQNYTKHQVQYMATRKTYNSPDTENRLIFVEKRNEDFGGYKRDLLADSLTPLEIDNYVCTKCKGVMVDACQMGEEQTPVCQGCAGKRNEVLPMIRSRKRIPDLKSKCPLYTRGCVWKGTLQETREHLEVCQEFIIVCPYMPNCKVFIRRSELGDHSFQCLMRIVQCEYCGEQIVFQDLIPHYGECLDYPLVCPNKCLLTFKRREMEEHLREVCANTSVECPYKRFGCEDGVKRGELTRHNNENECKHLDLKSEFALVRLDKVEQHYADNNHQLQNKLEEYGKEREEMRKEKKETSRKFLKLKQMLDEQDNKATTHATKQKEVEEILDNKTKEITELTKRLDEQKLGKTEEILVFKNMVEEQQKLMHAQSLQLNEVFEMIKVQNEDIVGLRKNLDKQQGKIQLQTIRHNELEQTVKHKSDEIVVLRNKIQEQKTMIQTQKTKQKEIETEFRRNIEVVPNIDAAFGQLPPNSEAAFENFPVFVNELIQQQVAHAEEIYVTMKKNNEEIADLGKKLEKQQNKLQTQTARQNEVEETVKRNSQETSRMSKRLEEQQKMIPTQSAKEKEIQKLTTEKLDGVEHQVIDSAAKLKEFADNRKKQGEEIIVNSKALGEQQKMLRFLNTKQNDLGESMKRKSQEMVEFAQKLDKQKMTMQNHIFEVEQSLKVEIAEVNCNVLSIQQANSVSARTPKTESGHPENPYLIKKNSEFENESNYLPAGPTFRPPPPHKEQDYHICNQT